MPSEATLKICLRAIKYLHVYMTKIYSENIYFNNTPAPFPGNLMVAPYIFLCDVLCHYHHYQYKNQERVAMFPQYFVLSSYKGYNERNMSHGVLLKSCYFRWHVKWNVIFLSVSFCTGDVHRLSASKD